MKRTLLNALLVAVLALGLTSVATAKKPCAPGGPHAPMPPHPMMMHGGPGGMNGMMIQIGLNDNQIEKIIDLKAKHQKEMLPLARQMRDMHQQRVELMKDPTANRDKLTDLTRQMGDIKAQIEGKQIDFMASLKKQMTDEQWEQFQARGPQGRCGDCDGPGRMKRPHRPGMMPPMAPEAPEPDGEQN